MGFFSQHGSYSNSGGDFEVAPDGVYTCRLTDVLMEKRASYDDPSVMEDSYRFTFETSDAADSQGNAYKFVKFTKTAYGNEKANLTLLIDAMVQKHLTPEEYNALDLDALKRKFYKVMVSEHTTAKGNLVNKIVSIKPMVAQGKPAATAGKTMGDMAPRRTAPPVPADDDLSELDDPFAE